MEKGAFGYKSYKIALGHKKETNLQIRLSFDLLNFEKLCAFSLFIIVFDFVEVLWISNNAASCLALLKVSVSSQLFPHSLLSFLTKTLKTPPSLFRTLSF